MAKQAINKGIQVVSKNLMVIFIVRTVLLRSCFLCKKLVIILQVLCNICLNNKFLLIACACLGSLKAPYAS